jgi:heme/copper-type cytochrome/quinol oxidase subunit 2
MNHYNDQDNDEDVFSEFSGVFTLWERSLKSRSLRTESHDSVRELVWTLVPTFILIVISVPSLELLYMMDAMDSADPVFTYKVIGHQWYWSYSYLNISEDNAVETVEFDSYMLAEEDVIEAEGLRLLEVTSPFVLPTNNNLHVLVTSTDVIHSWAIPSLGVKVDAVPGRLNHVCLHIKRPGIFYGQCSEICGVNHGFMPIKIIAYDNDYVPQADTADVTQQADTVEPQTDTAKEDAKSEEI